jgi:hypothetical protein
MSEALEMIVDGYVRLNDRRSLTELKAHREDLIAELKARKGWFDLSQSIRQFDEDIVQIEAGLARLDAVSAPLVSSDWQDAASAPL